LSSRVELMVDDLAATSMFRYIDGVRGPWRLSSALKVSTVAERGRFRNTWMVSSGLKVTFTCFIPPEDLAKDANSSAPSYLDPTSHSPLHNQETSSSNKLFSPYSAWVVE